MSRRYGRRLGLVTVGVLVALGSAQAAVQPDATFDADGLAFVDFGSLTDSARAVAVQPDGRVLLAGLARQGSSSSNYVDAMAVTRLNADGTLDTAFGTAGKFTAVGGSPATFGGADARAIAVQSDGKIVVAGGYNPNDGSGYNLMVLRLNANGTLDAAFGSGGIVQLAQPGRIDAIALQADGRIVLAGFASPGGGNQALAIRLEANGTVDAGFGTYLLSRPGINAEFRDVRVLADGSILLAGTDEDLLLVRLTSAGQPDTSFSGDGIVAENLTSELLGGVAIGSGDSIEAMAVDADGTIVVAGGRRPATGNQRAIIARFTSAGALDTGFDADGWRDLPIETTSDLAYGVAIAVDGSIVAAGLGMRVAQVSADGSTVSSLASTLDGTQAITQLARQADGKIVGSGERGLGGFDYQFVGVRFAVTPLTPTPTDTTPDAFSFVDQSSVATSSVVVSAPVTISGLTAAASVTVTGGEVSVGCTGTFGAAATTIVNGQTICARHTSASTGAATVATIVTIGGVSDTFSSTTLADADTTPAAFSFTDVAGVERSATVTSGAVTITGINAAAAVTVTGGEYSIGCTGTFVTAAGTINSGQTVCVRHAAAADFATSASTTLTVGGVSDTFTSTTEKEKNGGGGAAGGSFALLLGLLGLATVGRARRARTVRQ